MLFRGKILARVMFPKIKYTFPNFLKPFCWLLGIVLIVGCSSATELSSTAYDYTKALFSISNRKDTEGLTTAKQKIESSEQAGEISAAEAKALLGIVAMAESGKWDKANQRARQLMEQQYSRTPKPDAENQVTEPRGRRK